MRPRSPVAQEQCLSDLRQQLTITPTLQSFICSSRRALPRDTWRGAGFSLPELKHVLEVTPTIVIEESELHEEFTRAAGPGGQNINKVATAVQLRFNVFTSPALSDEVRQRLITLAGNRITAAGDLVIEAKRYRSQLQNREDARTQLADLIRRATIRPKPRRKTKPTAASQQKRLERKNQRSATKQQRRFRPGDEA